MTEKPALCIYHGADLDGQCCGAICQHAFNLRGQEVELLPVDYGDHVPDDKITGREVFICDWSFQPWSRFEEVVRLAAGVYWIDHHKSAIDEYQQRGVPASARVMARLSLDHAACELAWSEFFGDVEMPLGVRLLGRYDVWDHDYSRNVLPFQYGMRIRDTDPRTNMQLWQDVVFSWPDRTVLEPIIREGEIILEYEQRKNELAVKSSWFPLDFAGLFWQACNHLGQGSMFFNSVWSPGTFDGVLSFAWRCNRWTVGLYSTHPVIDCGAIAKQYGGGGHPGAAGFQCAELPFELPKRM